MPGGQRSTMPRGYEDVLGVEQTFEKCYREIMDLYSNTLFGDVVSEGVRSRKQNGSSVYELVCYLEEKLVEKSRRDNTELMRELDRENEVRGGEFYDYTNMMERKC